MREIPVEITPVKPVTTLSRTNANPNNNDTTASSNPSSRAAALAALIAEEDNDDEDGFGGGIGFGFDEEEEEEMTSTNNNQYGSRKYTDNTDEITPTKAAYNNANNVSSPNDSINIGHRAWTIDSTFTSIHDWQFDRTVVEADMLPSAIEWIEIARAIHTG